MSCGNGCGCCPKCGCRATCTCNQSMWFDETMDDFSYSVSIMAGETGKCGANCGCPTGTCANEGFSTGFFSGAASNAAHWGCRLVVPTSDVMLWKPRPPVPILQWRYEECA